MKKNSIKNQIIPPRIPELDIVVNTTKQEEGKQSSKTNAKTCKTKELVSGTTKMEQVVFDSRKNPALYDERSKEIEILLSKFKNKTISTVASIDFDKMKSLGVSIPHVEWLTPFDREILSIVSSLYSVGNEYQSPLMIYQALSGNKENVRLTPDMRLKIINSLRKLRLTEIQIDSSQEEKAGWNKKGKYEGALLPSERIEIMTLNGQETIDCIRILRKSPLYEYAEGKNQISRVNIEMLNVPINNTEENVVLKCHLLRLIMSMKNPKSNLKTIIRYDTLYEYLGLDENDNSFITRRNKMLIRDRTKEILKSWIKEGLITSFEEETEGRGKKAVKIKITL